MTKPYTMKLMKGGNIGFISTDDRLRAIDRKANCWTQIFPFKKPIRGQVGFIFSKVDNSLLGIEIYYANLCLSSYYVEFGEFFQDNETVEILSEIDNCADITTCYFHCDLDGQKSSQTFEMAPPANGLAVIDFRAEVLVSIELIGFENALELP